MAEASVGQITGTAEWFGQRQVMIGSVLKKLLVTERRVSGRRTQGPGVPPGLC